jgi:hypothetical protein
MQLADPLGTICGPPADHKLLVERHRLIILILPMMFQFYVAITQVYERYLN